MTYFKATLVGTFTALIAIVIVVLAMLRAWISQGDAGMFVSISSWQILLAALIGFAAGFWFILRRARRRSA